MMFSQFVSAPSPGCDRDRARPQRLPAGNVARSIADDIDFIGRKFPSMLFFCARPGKCSEPVPIMVIVGKGAEFKEMPDPVMTELKLSAAGEIAGKESEDDVLSRL